MSWRLVPRLHGWYLLRGALLLGKHKVAEAETSIAILPPPVADRSDETALRSLCGICTHFGRPTYDRPETRELLFERCFFYEFVTTPGRKRTFGLLKEDLSPRPAFVASAVAANALAGRSFLRRIEHPDDRVHLYVFGPEDDPLLAAWITEVGLARKIREPNAKPAPPMAWS